ncbi:hypothetical protein [Enterobacter pseudoroggenkampii]|uniref:hypothetical protein n=1 Tax=Enterobacter pseudoroggenkampii TaxID=2996112 RepID=UPI0022656927|nr:hypothetical protein [Enterobacter pseudoroggenkampii]MCX8289095.1 hypothetical protein [Enterobacter pseudoroggenkampii]
MNKFAVLNHMQRNVKAENYGANGSIKSWNVSASFTYKGITRTRTISYITKVKGEYVISFTGEKYKTFMGALSSLMVRYLCSLTSLVASSIFGDSTTTVEAELEKTFTNPVTVSPALKSKIQNAYQDIQDSYAAKGVTGYLKIDVAFSIAVNSLNAAEIKEIRNIFGITSNNIVFKDVELFRAIESII